jgi:acyl carrier protein
MHHIVRDAATRYTVKIRLSLLLFSSKKFSMSVEFRVIQNNTTDSQAPGSMNQQIKQKVEALVAKILGDPENSTNASSGPLLLGAAGGFDSTKTLELIVAVEQEFGIAMNDDEISPDNLGSTENLARFIASKQPG